MFLFRTKKKINTTSVKLRVLVSPLEWGLGHATRCIPVISALLLNKCEVFLAGEGATARLLKSEFPEVNLLPLAGYRVNLCSNKSFFALKIISQFPKIIYAIYRERRWLKKIIKQYKINAVISDNRIGLHDKTITSVYITHQLVIKTGNRFTSAIAGWIHWYCISKFDECWVPDFEKNGLAGQLSHPFHVPENVHYLGALSRFEQEDNLKKKYDLLIILSGPEPQRTIIEKLLLKELLLYNGRTLLIRGLPASTEIIAFNKRSVGISNHLPGKMLSKAIQQADIVISRSGYTTVMDLVKLGKKAILVPTPGQTEQEYLASYLKDKKVFFSMEQEGFNLSQALEEYSQFEFAQPVVNMEQYKVVIQRFVQQYRPELFK